MASQEQKEKAPFMCPNNSCKKAFTKPLKALDITANSGEVYEACPYCLSNVNDIVKYYFSDTPAVSPSTKAASCVHYFGYLYERAEKSQVPDECILCKNLVSCMLKSSSQKLPQEETLR